MRDTEKERQRHRQRGKQAACRQPDAGLDPETPGSCPGPKAGTKPQPPRDPKAWSLEQILINLGQILGHAFCAWLTVFLLGFGY